MAPYLGSSEEKAEEKAEPNPKPPPPTPPAPSPDPEPEPEPEPQSETMMPDWMKDETPGDRLMDIANKDDKKKSSS